MAEGPSQELYSRKTGFIYIFNLIVGTGALALPAAFAQAGWALGIAIILLLSFISFMTATFMIEAMSIANAILLKCRRAKRNSDDRGSDDNEIIRQLTNRSISRREDRERDPLIPPELGEQNEEIRRLNSTANTFEIVQRVEMGRMASMFLPKYGLYLFYLCLCVYLYGDLAIYITAVATSLRDIACINTTSSEHGNETQLLETNLSDILPDEMCWSESIGITRYDAYRMFAILFILVLGPFTFCNVQKTKYLQMFTTTMRWAAFLIMITLATIKLASGDRVGHPPAANILALPNFFGICVYSFMCHHSLPSLVSPIANKRGIMALFLFDYFIITAFYLLLALTGIFAFQHLEDLYTLNFLPEQGVKEEVISMLVHYFLSLFPVFTLSTNFPIIAITLRNNLRTLFNLRDEEDEFEEEVGESGSTVPDYIDATHDSTYSTNGANGLTSTTSSRRIARSQSPMSCVKICSSIVFPLLAIAPPFTIALFVENVQLLVSATGSYAGAGIQYIVPLVLVYQARARLTSSTIALNPYSSPFRHWIWIWFVVIWTIICIVFVTVNYIIHPSSSSSFTSRAFPGILVLR